MRVWPWILLALGAWCLPSALQAAELFVVPSQPMVGDSVAVVIHQEGIASLGEMRLVATYGPGTVLARTKVVEAYVASEPIAWKPRKAGLVRLELRDVTSDAVLATRDLAVRYPGRPRGGLAVLLLAGLALAGGVGIGLRFHFGPPAR